jgi:hypothetical protein
VSKNKPIKHYVVYRYGLNLEKDLLCILPTLRKAKDVVVAAWSTNLLEAGGIGFEEVAIEWLGFDIAVFINGIHTSYFRSYCKVDGSIEWLAFAGTMEERELHERFRELIDSVMKENFLH